MTNSIDDLREEYLQRCREPDGYCFYCGGPANQHHAVGPLTVTIEAPNTHEIHEFCNWVCLGHWAADAAGGDLILAEPSAGNHPSIFEVARRLANKTAS
jgi:hypothetical protein